MIQLDTYIYSIFQLSYVFLCFYYIYFPFRPLDDLEYYSFFISIFLYIIYTMMDLLLTKFVFNKSVYFLLIFNSFIFEYLSTIQYQYSQNLLNIFLSSYCTFGIFKYSFLFIQYYNLEQEPLQFTFFNG